MAGMYSSIGPLPHDFASVPQGATLPTDGISHSDILNDSTACSARNHFEKHQSETTPDDSSSKEQADSSIGEGAQKEVDEGMETGIKDLYRENPRCPWDEWAPDDVGINAEATSSWKKFALVVRREKREADQSYLALHSITIQSPIIKDRLGVVFDSYKGISTNLKKLTFNAPFHEFFYRWDRFEDTIRHENDLALKHMNLLYKTLSAEIKPHIERAQDLLVNDVITFDYLWSLFEPGTEVYTSIDDQDRLYNLINSSYKQVGPHTTIFSLSCRYIDCDGSNFGYVSSSLAISEFDGIKPLPELTVLPSHLYPDIETIRVKLNARGRKFEQLNGFHYQSYSGLCKLNSGYYGGSNKRNIDDGRIIVDAKMYATYNPDSAPRLQVFEAPPPPPDQPLNDPMAVVIGFEDHGQGTAMPFAGPVYKAMMPMPRRGGPIPRPAQSIGWAALTENQYALCSPMLRGYCLSAKQWVQFYVENVREIQWNEEAFKRLVLPHDYKKIIWAFVDSQLAFGDQFDDVVQGKGQGIIMLLSGEPGVGKTLTAESVAEEMKRPLYSMSAGELGNTAEEVEMNLHKVLEISTKWGAVLLLDECDVFLEKRSTSDIQRNKLVSVFLRLLEYYKGVMFLTTNRVSAFDPAFESRIHLTIDYPKLDFGSRLHVWRTFVRPHEESLQYASTISKQELETLAAVDMNGRQIKNVVKTARLLAAREKRELVVEDVETVLRVKRGSPSGVRDGGF